MKVSHSGTVPQLMTHMSVAYHPLFSISGPLLRTLPTALLASWASPHLPDGLSTLSDPPSLSESRAIDRARLRVLYLIHVARHPKQRGDQKDPTAPLPHRGVDPHLWSGRTDRPTRPAGPEDGQHARNGHERHRRHEQHGSKHGRHGRTHEHDRAPPKATR